MKTNTWRVATSPGANPCGLAANSASSWLGEAGGRSWRQGLGWDKTSMGWANIDPLWFVLLCVSLTSFSRTCACTHGRRDGTCFYKWGGIATKKKWTRGGFHWSDSTKAVCVSLQFCVFPILNRFKARSPVDTSGEAWGTPPNVGVPEFLKTQENIPGIEDFTAVASGAVMGWLQGIPKGDHGSYPPNLGVSIRFSHQCWNIPKRNLKCSSFYCVKKIMAHMCNWRTHQQAQRLKKSGEIMWKSFLGRGSGGGGLFAARFVFSPLIASSQCLWEMLQGVMFLKLCTCISSCRCGTLCHSGLLSTFCQNFVDRSVFGKCDKRWWSSHEWL